MTTPEQWDEASSAFTAGESARSIARRLGLHHSAVGRRAKREGWAAQAGAGGAPARSGARDATAEEAEPPARTDVGALLTAHQPPPLDLTNPEHQRAVLAAAMGERSGQAALDHIDALSEDQRSQRAERLGYHGLGWTSRAGF